MIMVNDDEAAGDIWETQWFEVTRPVDSVGHLIAFDNICGNHGNIWTLLLFKYTDTNKNDRTQMKVQK